MKINDKLLKPITEVSYLRAENVERYRVIIRYFYEEYEKIRYMLYRDDIFNAMKQSGFFDDYTEELAQSDLDALENWGNLITMQDSSKVSTLEEFRNRRYRYQLSDYTIEIERMTQRLESLEIEGASLEPTLLERIRKSIEKIPEIVDKDDLVVHAWWNDLNADFIRLNRNYQDYIKELNGIKSEEMMMSKEFILFKDRIIQYLRTFVKGLQEEGVILESYVQNIDPSDLRKIMDKVIAHEATIPRLDRKFDPETFEVNIKARWHNIHNWFVGGIEESEINRMGDITLEIIRKITRYAQQIGEFYHKGSNKKEDYRHIAKIFSECETLEDAHKLSAMVFGVSHTYHLKGLNDRDTENINSSVYNEEPTYYSRSTRSRVAVERRKREPAKNYHFEKQMQLQEIINQEKRKRSIIQTYIKNHVIDFSKLGKIDSDTRKTLLYWLSKGLSDKDLKSRTEWGQYFTVDKSNPQICNLECEDGTLSMPSYRLIFEGDIL